MGGDATKRPIVGSGSFVASSESAAADPSSIQTVDSRGRLSMKRRCHWQRGQESKKRTGPVPVAPGPSSPLVVVALSRLRTRVDFFIVGEKGGRCLVDVRDDRAELMSDVHLINRAAKRRVADL